MFPQITLIMNLFNAKLQPLISVQYSLLEMTLTSFSIFFFINHCLSNISLVWNTIFSCSMYICRWIFIFILFYFPKATFWTAQRGVFYLYWDQLLSLLVTLESKLLWRSRTQETPSLHLLGDWHCRWLLSCDHWSSRYTLWLSPERHLQHAEFFFLKRLDVQCQVIGKTLRNKAFSVWNILHWQSDSDFQVRLKLHQKNLWQHVDYDIIISKCLSCFCMYVCMSC